MNVFFVAAARKAAKPHRCVWCGEPINKGETYSYQAGLFDGEFQSNHYHPECWEATALDPDAEDGFMPHENPRPPTAGDVEANSWDISLVFQGQLL